MAGVRVEALVVGAGVCGLTTAIRLGEAGMAVTIVAAEPPEATTSAAAGAMWGPYLAEPRDRVSAWSQATLAELTRLAGEQGSGVRLVSGIEASRTVQEPPGWASLLPGFRPCTPAELPPGFVTGWRYTAPLVDMPVYLRYLLERFAALGGMLVTATVTSLQDCLHAAPVVVNCAGMGAASLVPDDSLVGIRGQLAVVANSGITEFFSEDTGLAPDLMYIYPHADTVVLGGTAEPGMTTRAPDVETARRIVARCAEVEPRLAGAEILEHRVGIRPSRPQIRVEEQRAQAGRLFHNYGHGGAGVSLTWGCADDLVAALGSLPSTG
jgi:D-amino-acid oxidase